MNVEVLKCRKCGYVWIPRGVERPKTCPNRHCHSSYWDHPVKYHSQDNWKQLLEKEEE